MTAKVAKFKPSPCTGMTGRRCTCGLYHGQVSYHGHVSDAKETAMLEQFCSPDFDELDFLRQEGALHAAIRALFVLVGIAGLCGALLFWLGAVGVIDLKGIFL